MTDYYLKDEERFGFLSSFAYWIGVKLPDIHRLYLFVLNDLKGKNVADLLDVGTGPADVPIMLAKSGKFGRIYAIDPSLSMLRIAKLRSKELNIKFGQGSSRSVPFKRTFDIIISSLSFHHWAEKEKSLRYLSGLLKKGGEIRIYEFERSGATGWRRYFISSHSVTKDGMIDVARRSGLTARNILQKDGLIRTTFVK